jgi:hypothetical protein
VKSTKQKVGFCQNNKSNLQQMMMHGTTVEERNTEVWDDAMPASKAPSTIQFAFQNIGGQPRQWNNAKSHALAEQIQQEQYDVFMFAEHGLNLAQVPIGHQWNIVLWETTEVWDQFGISMCGIFGKSSFFMMLTLRNRC